MNTRLGKNSNSGLRNISELFLAVAGLLLASQVAFAQGTRGTISGTVRDQNAAVIPNANVELIDAQKGATTGRTIQTDESGYYQFLQIEPSTYTIVITAPNFDTQRLVDVKVEPNRNLILDATLAVAGVGESVVTVSAGQQLIDRESATLGTTIDGERVVGLPLNGRNVLDLAVLQPGVQPGGGGFGNGSGFRTNGNRGVENNVSLDGANNNEVAVGGTIGAQPRPDAVQEFRLLTSNFEAEFGRNTGAVVNVVTRSGENRYHGNLRMFYRPTNYSAGEFFDNQRGQPLREFNRREYGGNIGGPIYFLNFGDGGPKIYDGKDKSFFFVDYEYRNQVFGATQLINSIPTVAERNGNFGTRTIIDPATGAPFPGNVIPANRITPISAYYLQFIPSTNAGSVSVGANEFTINNFFTTRVDHSITPNQVLSFTYNYFDSDLKDPFAFGGSAFPGFGSTDLRATDNYIGRYNWVINPSMVNSFLINYSKNDQPSVAPVNTTTPAQIGFTANFVANARFAGPPVIRFFDRGFQLGNTIQGPQARVSENIQYQDSLSWSIGNHRLKFGVDVVKYKQGTDFLFINQGLFTYSGLFGGNTTGDDFADFLIGTSPIAIQFGAAGRRDFRQMAYAGFAQDTWRVNNNLTVSIGLRYEYTSPLKDLLDRVSYYRPGARSELLRTGQLVTPDGRRVTVQGGNLPNGLVYVGDPDPVLGGTVPRGGAAPDKNNFAPRIGFAYSFDGDGDNFFSKLLGENRTVVRGAYGLYYGAVIGDTALQQLTAQGFSGTNAFFFPASGTLADPFAPDPYPDYNGNQGQIANPFASSSTVIAYPLTQSSQPIDPNIKTPQVTQFNLTLERAFFRNYVLGVSYVGNRGRKLYVREAVNPAVGTLLPNSLRFQGPAVPAPTTTNANSRRQNDDYRLGLNQLTTGGNSTYDALQVNFGKRLSDDGLLFQVAYTFSKSINDSDTQRGQLDLINRNAGRGLSGDDRPHRLVVSWVYQIPFARNTTGFLKRLLDGWELSGIYQYQSGDLISVGNPIDIDGTGGAILNFADFGPGAFQNADPRATGGRAFNANAFRIADCGANFSLCGGVGRRGTSGRNQFRLDNPINNWDMAFIKKIKLFSERNNLELRFEAFNLFNHAQFIAPDLNLGSLTTPNARFGTYTNTRGSRSIQLAARFSF